MEHIELIAVLGHPARLQHHRRPPPAENLLTVGGHRIRQSADPVAIFRVGKMADIDVRCRHRSHSQHVNSSWADDRGALAALLGHSLPGDYGKCPRSLEVLRCG
jgi:hypothetical protein